MAGLSTDLEDIVVGIWGSEFAAPVARVDPDRLVAARGPGTAGIVRIRGAWTGAVVIECPDLMVPGLFAGQAERPLGDLALMIAEAFAALLPGRCGLSTPETVAVTGDRCRIPNAVPILTGAFGRPGLVFSVTVFQSLPTPG